MGNVELRHIRYFVAVADTGSLSVAAHEKLHTSQPSLSRQIRDLEEEVGAQLLTRGPRGIQLTPAGRAFLDHAGLVLSQVEAATEAARKVALPARQCFTMGFLIGHELLWMPEALRILRDALPNVDLTISSKFSPLLAELLAQGKLDAAFLRREPGHPELAYELLEREYMVVYLPSDHRLAQREAIDIKDLAGEVFITVAPTAPVLRGAIDRFLESTGLGIRPSHEVDHLTMAMSMIASTRGVAILPVYLRTFLPWAVTTRPLRGDSPYVDLVFGYRKSNPSPILRLLLSRLDEMIASATGKPR